MPIRQPLVAAGEAGLNHDLDGRDEPMTEKQAVILRDLCLQTNRPFDSTLTQAQAAQRIKDLESRADSSPER